MKIRFFALVLLCLQLFALLAVCEDKKAVDTVKTKAAKVSDSVKMADTLIIKARLVEIPGKFAPNDLYNYVYIMKYRVLSVEKGVFKEKEILVGHYNPLIPRSMIKDKMDSFVNGNVKKFEVGATHLLQLVEPIETVWTDAVEDEYFDSDEKYFAISADDIK